MGGRISVIGTEAYYGNVDDPDNHMREVAFDYLSDWWSDEIEDSSDDYDAIFSRLHSEIPESELRTSSMSDRRQDANEWLENNVSNFESRGSIQIVDWVEKSGDGWPLGLAGVGTAMTDSSNKTGITNIYRFENPSYFFQGVEEFGTVFHELLHNYSVLHEHGATNGNGEASFIFAAGKDEDDDSCFWNGDSDQRADWTSFCTRNNTRNHIDDYR
jgi:hypothetical protein